MPPGPTGEHGVHADVAALSTGVHHAESLRATWGTPPRAARAPRTREVIPWPQRPSVAACHTGPQEWRAITNAAFRPRYCRQHDRPGSPHLPTKKSTAKIAAGEKSQGFVASPRRHPGKGDIAVELQNRLAAESGPLSVRSATMLVIPVGGRLAGCSRDQGNRWHVSSSRCRSFDHRSIGGETVLPVRRPPRRRIRS